MGIILSATDQSLELVTTTTSQVDVVVSAIDQATTTFTPVSQNTTITTATTTVVLAAPAASTQRTINDIEIVVVGGSSQTITVQKDVATNNFRLVGPITLSSGEALRYTSDRGWRVFDAQGREKCCDSPGGTHVHWNNFSPESTNLGAVPTASMWLFPFPYGQVFPGRMTLNTVKFGISMNNTTTSVGGSSSYASTIRIGLYTLANSTQLSLLNSASQVYTKGAVTDNSNFVHGARFLTVHSSAWSSQPVLSQGHYWMGVVFSTGNTSHSASLQVVNNGGRSNASGDFNVSVGAQQEFYYFHGGVNTTNIPNNIAASTIIGNDTRALSSPLIIFVNTIQTA